MGLKRALSIGSNKSTILLAALLAPVQLGVIWFGALMAGVTLLGMRWRLQRERAGIAGRNWHLVLGVCLFYPLLNSWIVL
jgi:hypothetical protein